MKQVIIFIGLFAAVILGADGNQQSIDPGPAKLPDAVSEIHQENDQIVVITDAEFVPFSQYLGLSDINDLPPSSAGERRDEPKKAQQRAQHRIP